MSNLPEAKKGNVAENCLVEIIDQSGVENAVIKLIEKNHALLPANIATERIKASAGFYVANRKDLLALSSPGKMQMLYGILKEAMVGCEAGIDYDIIPFKGEPVIVRKKEGWFKIIDLVKPAEIVRFTVNVVTSNDIHSFNPVTEELVHELKGVRGQEFKDIVATYAYIKLANGFEKTVYMTKEDLEQLKNISPSGKTAFSPWNSNSIRMVKAKIVKELAKEMYTLFSGRVNSVLANIISSDEIAISNIDSRGYITNSSKTYEKVTGSQKETINQTEEVTPIEDETPTEAEVEIEEVSIK